LYVVTAHSSMYVVKLNSSPVLNRRIGSMAKQQTFATQHPILGEL